MFKKLLPKEEKFFEDFNSMITTVKEMIDLTKEFFTGGKYDEKIVLQLKSLEKRCDEMSHKIINKLNKSFLTPFDREDIFELIKSLEKLSDVIYASVSRVKLYHLTSPLPVSEKFLQIAGLQIDILYKAILELKVKHVDSLKTVKDLESEADQIYRDTISTLFSEETNAIELIKKKEILDILETITDKCQTLAGVLITISLKNG
jgi:predicted phosphate transport protein (TIGR00153 family)